MNKKDLKLENTGILIKIVISSIILASAVLGGKFLFDEFKKDEEVSGVRRLLSTKHDSLECIDLTCNGFIATKKDKSSKYKIIIYNVNGKKIANYNNKNNEIPIEIWDKYYISKNNVEKYYIKNRKGKVIYKTKNKLEVLNDNLVKITNDKEEYSIINKEGEIIYDNIIDINLYLDGKYIQIKTNDKIYILDSKGNKILEGYKISKLVADEKQNILYAIVKNEKNSVYNYYDFDKEKIIGDDFNSYDVSENEYEYIITKKENGKEKKYILNKNGKQEKLEYDLDNIIDEIEEKIDKDEYKLYKESIYKDNQKEILVDNIKDKSFGVLNIKNNKYIKIYNYNKEKDNFYSDISKLEAADEQYLKIFCSTNMCDARKSIIYDLKEKEIVYFTSDIFTSFVGYEGGYKVIKKDKYIVLDKDNKELYKSDNNVIIVDKDVIIGKNKTDSLILYSVKKETTLSDEKASLVTINDEILYKYIDDKNNMVILNDKGEEVLKVKDNNSLKQINDSYIYLENNLVYIYNIDKDKTYKYKLKENEKITYDENNIIESFKNVIFINNNKDKYIKVINFKGEQIKKINNVLISDIKINIKEDKAFIIVMKTSEKIDKYGLYIVE